MPAVEVGVATSVLVLGLFLALAVRLPLETSAPLVIVFALSHGNVHGLALARTGALTPEHALGFLLAAAGLQLAGVGLGTRLTGDGPPAVLRASGLVMACSGLALWV